MFCLCTVLFVQQTSGQSAETPAPKQVRFSLRNNSWWFRKVAIITYEPNQEGNNTVVFLAGPGMSRRFVLPEGTRLYNASNKQVDVVMSGKALNDKPLLVVQRRDEGKIISLF